MSPCRGVSPVPLTLLTPTNRGGGQPHSCNAGSQRTISLRCRTIALTTVSIPFLHHAITGCLSYHGAAQWGIGVWIRSATGRRYHYIYEYYFHKIQQQVVKRAGGPCACITFRVSQRLRIKVGGPLVPASRSTAHAFTTQA